MKSWIAAVIIGVVAIGLYIPSLSFDFVGLDEQDHITNRQVFLRGWHNIGQFFTHNSYYPSGVAPHYRPLHTLSFAINAMIGGTQQLPYRVTNILLHALAAILVLFFFLRLGYSTPVSFVAGLLFAIHPLARQIVAWIPGRNDVLLAVFLLSAGIWFIRFCETHRPLAGGLAVFFFVCGLLTKETAVMFPLLALTYVLLIQRPTVKRPYVFLGLATGVMLTLWYGLRWYALREVTMDRPFFEIFGMVVQRAPALLEYAGKFLLPWKLSVMPSPQGIHAVVGALALVSVGIASIQGWFMNRRRVIFGLVWFLLMLVPSLISYESQSRTVFFEYRVYLSIIGLLMVLAEIPWSRLIRSRVYRIAFVGVVVAGGVVSTVLQLGPLSSAQAFWENAVETSPKLARAHNGLGSVYGNRNELDAALREFVIARDLGPQEPKIHNNIGSIYLRKQMIVEAQREFVAEIGINPGYFVAHHNLALTYAIQQRPQEAAQEWIVAIQLNPWYVLPYQGLAVLYAQQGNIPESVRYIKQAQALGGMVPADLLNILNQYERTQ